MNLQLLLAQTASQPAPSNTNLITSMFPLLAAVGVFYWWMYRGQRKDRQKVETMLGNLKRNDRVLTIGGILGTVIDVKEGEVTLKVDETNNVKMHFLRSAIKEVLAESTPKPN